MSIGHLYVLFGEVSIQVFAYFLKYILLIMLLQLSHFFLPFIFFCLVPLFPLTFPLFFGFSISYTILNLPLSILYLSFMPLILCTFSLFSPLLLSFPAGNPPWDLHFCDSVPVLLVCLVCFCFLVQLLIVVCCHFTVHSFDLLLLLR